MPNSTNSFSGMRAKGLARKLSLWQPVLPRTIRNPLPHPPSRRPGHIVWISPARQTAHMAVGNLSFLHDLHSSPSRPTSAWIQRNVASEASTKTKETRQLRLERYDEIKTQVELSTRIRRARSNAEVGFRVFHVRDALCSS